MKATQNGDVYVLELSKDEITELQLVLASTVDEDGMFEEKFPLLDGIGRGIFQTFPYVSTAQRLAWNAHGRAVIDISQLAAAAAHLRGEHKDESVQ